MSSTHTSVFPNGFLLAMKARRVIIIEEMFQDICTDAEQQTVNALYKKNNKGSAIVFMLKRIRTQWNEFMEKAKHVSPSRTSLIPESSPRLVKFNYNGVTTFEQL